MSTILITGATDGIGLALARLYQTGGARVIAVARRPLDQLDSALFSAETYCQSDLSEADCAEPICRFLEAQGIQEIDLLIHNAGVGEYGAVDAQSAAHIRQLVAVNLSAPIALTHALLPRMQQANNKIVFISSVTSALASPQYAVYSASKAALDGLARSLRVELQDAKVSVQLIHPGATRTGMHRKSGISKDTLNWERFPSAEHVAQQIAKAIEGKQKAVTIGLGNRVLRLAGKEFAWVVDGAMRVSSRRKHSPSDLLLPERAAQAPKTCLITGAADGIGRALAFRFASQGYHIIGLDADAQRAQQTEADIRQKGGWINFLIADLTSESAIQALLKQLNGKPLIDLLIHNAGISAVGAFAEIDLARQQAVIQLNLLAPLLLTAGLLKQQRLVAGASIAFISSLSHFTSYPGASSYAASKDGLASYARSLSVAYAAQNLHLLTIYPGPTRTAHARRYSPDNSREGRRMPPEQVADAIYQAIKTHKRTLIPGFSNRLLAGLGRTFPTLMERIMRKTLYEKLV